MRMWRKSLLAVLMVALIAVAAACGNDTESKEAASAEKAELTVSAAASLTDALNDIKEAYANVVPNVTITYNFGASGALQKQIEEGAPADLFLSAATKNMKALVDKGLIASDRTTTLLNNELVAIVPKDNAAKISGVSELTSDAVTFIAVGIPDSVPAGQYAKDSLTQAGLWDSLQSKLVQGKDVKQVLQYVETGNADIGFVYKTDALVSDKVEVAFAVDPATYTKIEYPIGIVKATTHSEQAQAFYDYLQTEEAMNIFTQYGFSAPNN
ncbi:molybdate ABC transporter substrate-binding protein [Cohnella thailandensis]|uniref:Molybdate ABC transporter substrate-binding protein n=1 Tax=Cohnella thailandensis TaxID=557557 RepID=A0A841T2Y9_9BACL|nr:molybdate ABC transporter substrate-binding protein [Cohnella thailandensis]MBB6636975.1 molybdate ABC transporter substrate-binding protein [Cohnella thailandensis]